MVLLQEGWGNFMFLEKIHTFPLPVNPHHTIFTNTSWNNNTTHVTLCVLQYQHCQHRVNISHDILLESWHHTKCKTVQECGVFKGTSESMSSHPLRDTRQNKPMRDTRQNKHKSDTIQNTIMVQAQLEQYIEHLEI